MTEVVVAQEAEPKSSEELFQDLWERMPENMRLYQELITKRNSLYDSLKSHRDRIADIDIDKPALSHPSETAYSALSVYIADRQLSAVQGEMIELDRAGGWLKFLELRGREVRVEPLGDRFDIHLLSEGNYVKRTKKPKNGIITRVSLTPSNGGSIQFEDTGFFKDFDRSAHPLFDRHKQEPQFKIEFI